MSTSHNDELISAPAAMPEEAGSHETSATAAALEGLQFPVDKATIIQYVQGQAEVLEREKVLTALDTLEDKTFESPTQVMAELPE